jgi:hypothetical protein
MLGIKCKMQKISFLGIFFLSCFLSVTVFASSLEASAKVLKAEITHSESLPALDKRLRPGETFDKSVLKVEGDQRLNFYQIPEWMAGRFSAREIIRTSFFDYATNKIDNSVVRAAINQNLAFGEIRDSQNQIWVEDHTPILSVSEIEGGRTSIYSLINEQYPVENSSQQVIMKEFNLNTTVDKATNKITAVIRIERLTRCIPQGGNVREDRTCKVFSPEGYSVALITDSCMLNRVGPMPVPANQAEIQKDLATFLKRYGK